MSCAECEKTEHGQRSARIKRWVGVAFVGLVLMFIARQQLRDPAQALPTPDRVQETKR
jgi:hypothetical protein